ncbi:ABC transporter ATP-binding protein [Micromonospora krabiensis]|uniref:Amino acid/amide ABC transporter ATP-binding protein 1, HAAT family (TC 3.A.1.4.-) n=1 Tax=Micromonospora krabiensis TaxID=307121 RepID=A0A1C3MYL7_9ACTN|nr:ABC transporter ATP-binding protein [Micromonospora krabiensis]SBV25418.1 amino acid/amide ABC transporter ATP-binding protein 1, HAAT family (TC 3.A.1.4.-) [Micromonospora krabiensis]
MTPLLAAHGLTVRYGSLAALDGVDLRVDHGQRHALIGPNGAGKTTLLDVIAGATRPVGGRVLLAGRDVTRRGPAARSRRGVGRIHQRPAVWATLTVAENVRVAALPHAVRPGRWRPGVARRAARATADTLLDRVGLHDLAARPAGQLAHGQRRQLEIAMALAGRPRLLLLDEPAAGLSATEVGVLVGFLRELPRAVAVLLVEHRLDLVYELCDTVTVLRDGRTLAAGSPAEIRGSELVRRAYAEGVV